MSSGFGRIGECRRCYDGVTDARVTDVYRLTMNVRPDPAGSRSALIAAIPRHRPGAAIPRTSPAADMSVADRIRLNHA
jgi:hypothetical protein